MESINFKPVTADIRVMHLKPGEIVNQVGPTKDKTVMITISVIAGIAIIFCLIKINENSKLKNEIKQNANAANGESAKQATAS